MSVFPSSTSGFKLKALLRFPYRVTAGSGIEAPISNGTITFGLDYAPLASAAPISTPSNFTVALLDTATGEYKTATLDQLPTTTTGDVRTARGDANYAILAADRYVALTASLTTARTWSLPAASTVTGGIRIAVYDEAGGITSTNTLTVGVTGSDTIDGASTFVLNNAYAGAEFRSDGISKWTVAQIGTTQIAAGALAATTAGRAKMADGFLSADSAGRAKTAALYTQPSMVSELAAPAGGRLTLTSGTPVLTSTVSAATALYYAPYLHDALPIYNGTVWTWRQFSEMTLTLDATGHVTNTNYDVFAFDDSGTLRIGTGPAWSSSTARGTGAGTTELARLAGRMTNAVSITLRNNSTNYSSIGVGRALYLGSFRTGSAGQTDFHLGGSSAGGTAALLNVWNMYNRRRFLARVNDSTSNWNYSTNTVRSLNNSTGNRISFLNGLAEDNVSAILNTSIFNVAANRAGTAGLGFDSTTAFAIRAFVFAGSSTTQAGVSTQHSPSPQLGFHYFQALENADSGAQITIYGASDMALIGDWWG
ncbi:tail spike protein [Pseudanabaena phage Pam5]|nr:tail spike protein [Pseudanabaena phage Pam5]